MVEFLLRTRSTADAMLSLRTIRRHKKVAYPVGMSWRARLLLERSVMFGARGDFGGLRKDEGRTDKVVGDRLNVQKQSMLLPVLV